MDFSAMTLTQIKRQEMDAQVRCYPVFYSVCEHLNNSDLVIFFIRCSLFIFIYYMLILFIYYQYLYCLYFICALVIL